MECAMATLLSVREGNEALVARIAELQARALRPVDAGGNGALPEVRDEHARGDQAFLDDLGERRAAVGARLAPGEGGRCGVRTRDDDGLGVELLEHGED